MYQILDHGSIVVNILCYITEIGELVKLWEIPRFRKYLDNEYVLKKLSYNFGLYPRFYFVEQMAKFKDIFHENKLEDISITSFLKFYESYKGPVRFDVGDKPEICKNQGESGVDSEFQEINNLIDIIFIGFKPKIKLWDESKINDWCCVLNSIEKHLDLNYFKDNETAKIITENLKSYIEVKEVLDDKKCKHKIYKSSKYNITWNSQYYLYIKSNIYIPSMELYNFIINIAMITTFGEIFQTLEEKFSDDNFKNYVKDNGNIEILFELGKKSLTI